MNIFQNNQNYFNNPLFASNDQENNNLFDPQEAFMLGNLFRNLYMTYKGFSNYCLQPMNQRQKALLEVQIYEFAAHEINLYLDTHSHSQSMIDLYKKYIDKANKARQSFEKHYGPLVVRDSNTTQPFEWIKGPWPWEYQI